MATKGKYTNVTTHDAEELKSNEREYEQVVPAAKYRRFVQGCRDRIEFVNKIKKCVDDKEDIDIYQFVAFITSYSNREYPTSVEVKKMKYLYIYEAIICIMAQIIGIIVIIEEVISDGMENKSSCNLDLNESPLIYKILAFSLSIVAGFVSWDLFQHEKGMYMGGYEDCCKAGNSKPCSLTWDFIPSWISIFWLEVGAWTNRIVAIGAVGGSFIVIYFSDNAFDMVLNSVALFFLLELDNMLCTTDRYAELKKFLKDWPEDGVKPKRIKSMTDIMNMGEKLSSFTMINKAMGKQEGNCCCNGLMFCAMFVDLCCFGIYVLVGRIAVIACLVIPFYIGICY